MASLRIANDLKNLIKRMIYDEVYPVGSIYISMNSTSPATKFGGTWTQITDRFLYCTKSSKTTGGSTNTKSHTLTIDQMPSHNHNTKRRFARQVDWNMGYPDAIHYSGDWYDTYGVETMSNTGGSRPLSRSKSSSIYYLLCLVQNSLKKAGVIYE